MKTTKSVNAALTFFSLSLLSACGGSNNDSVENKTANTSPAQLTSNLSFHLPAFLSQSGELVITNASGGQVINESVTNLNGYEVTTSSGQALQISWQPENTLVVCQVTRCGRYTTPSANDTNSNTYIDKGEAFTVSYSLSAAINTTPGSNRVYLSPLSSLGADFAEQAPYLTMQAQAFFHQTAAITATAKYEFMNNAINAAFFFTGASDADYVSRFDSFAETWVSLQTPNEVIADYFKLWQKQVNREDMSQAMAALSTLDKLKHAKFNLSPITADPNSESRVLLTQVRDLLAVANLQQGEYNNEIEDKLANIEAMLGDNSKELVDTFATVVGDVLSTYSPLGDYPGGEYQWQTLTVTYDSAPYRWTIKGDYKGVTMDAAIRVPEWRISGVLGNRVRGELNATLSKGTSTLAVSSKELLIELDPGAATTFNQSGVISLTTDAKLSELEQTLDARLSVSLKRFFQGDALKSTLDSFSLVGEHELNGELTDISVFAIDETPLDTEDDAYQVSLVLGSNINGAKNFKIAILGGNDQLSELSNATLSVLINNKVLEVQLVQTGSQIKAKLIGLNGRWLDLSVNGKNYTGALYYGNYEVGKIKVVRGIPGVLFPDGSFESLF
jgi:hypothetical protein